MVVPTWSSRAKHGTGAPLPPRFRVLGFRVFLLGISRLPLSVPLRILGFRGLGVKGIGV